MALRLAHDWLWDFWFAVDGDDVHVFYLKAPRALGDPELRHHHATVGHAVSRDLRTWRVLADALGAGPPGSFDDLATWTGSVVRHGGRWHLFYTGIARAEAGAIQRVGRASSGDLVRWERHGAVLEADPRWYETRRDRATLEHWRDPWVAWDAERRRFDMLLCARAADGPADGRGVVGHATSADLVRWHAAPPLSPPGSCASSRSRSSSAWAASGGSSSARRSATTAPSGWAAASSPSAAPMSCAPRRGSGRTGCTATISSLATRPAGTTPAAPSPTAGAGGSWPGACMRSAGGSWASSASRCRSTWPPTAPFRLSASPEPDARRPPRPTS